jgi:holo-[acyl-carrier protein] synthase
VQNCWVGIDVVEVKRFEAFLQALEPEQLREVFTESELFDVSGRKRRNSSLAARFAAKEAVIKVLQAIDAYALDWREIEIVKRDTGAPAVELHGAVAALARDLGIHELAVSLSHSRSLAVAQAVALRAVGA